MEDLVEPELDELKSIKREINNLTEATQLSRSRNPSVVESEGKPFKIRIFFFFHLFSRLNMYVAVTCTYWPYSKWGILSYGFSSTEHKFLKVERTTCSHSISTWSARRIRKSYPWIVWAMGRKTQAIRANEVRNFAFSSVSVQHSDSKLGPVQKYKTNN